MPFQQPKLNHTTQFTPYADDGTPYFSIRTPVLRSLLNGSTSEAASSLPESAMLRSDRLISPIALARASSSACVGDISRVAVLAPPSVDLLPSFVSIC